MTYASLSELKVWISQGTADTTDDAALLIALGAAKDSIDDYTDRSFEAAGTATLAARVFAADASGWCRIDDLGSLEDLVVSVDLDFDGVYETTLDPTSYIAAPANNISKGRAATGLSLRRGKFPVYGAHELVQVVGRWGWPETPDKVKQAQLIQAHRFHSRRRSPLGGIQAPDLSGGERLLERLDADVAVLLHKLRRSWNGLEV